MSSGPCSWCGVDVAEGEGFRAAEPVGEVPRGDGPDPSVAEPERLFAEKYLGGGAFGTDGRHGWLRIRPEKVTSWDFRKNPALRGSALPG